jgi:GNAT superfamily N-acetyltransferase
MSPSAFRESFQRVLDGFLRRHPHPTGPVAVDAPDPWRARARIGTLELRPLAEGDVAVLADFAARLGADSRTLFCPYPWDDPAALERAFQGAIAQARDRIDAMVVLTDGAATVGHAFLWKAGGNPYSAADGLEIPELGVAVADAWQGRGLGGLLVRWLQAVAAGLGRDAVELTTAPANDRGWSTYRTAGFEHLGDIRTPLGFDVTAATLGQAVATAWRVERQMAWVVRAEHRDRILAHLARKRAEAGTAAP